MLATIQQALVLTLAALTVLAATALATSGHATMAGALVVLALTGHALALAVEFMLMRDVNKADCAPHATWPETVQAWLGEIKHAPRVFGWRQPFRSNVWPDQPDLGPGSRGLLLVHGFICNRGLWNRWMRHLRKAQIPYVAVNLEPVFGSIDDYRSAIEAAVRTLEHSTGRAPVIVAHSMGGLAVRRWWIETRIDRVHHLITLGTPHHGTWLARWARSPNGRQMQTASPWRQALEAREGSDRAQRTTCFYSHCDNIVFPASTGTLAGADNRHLRAVAHVRMVDHPHPYQEALLRLRAVAD